MTNPKDAPLQPFSAGRQDQTADGDDGTGEPPLMAANMAANTAETPRPPGNPPRISQANQLPTCCLRT